VHVNEKKARIWQAPAALCVFLASMGVPAFAEDAPKTELMQEAKYESTGNTLQQFSTTFTLKDEERTRPLIFTFTNGPDGKPKFAWVRVFLSDRPLPAAKPGQPQSQPTGRMIISDKSFGKQDSVDVNLTGFIRQGSTIAIQGAGFKGAGVGWKLNSPPAGTFAVTDVNPKIARGGGTLTINGAGFSPRTTENNVYFEQTKARVTNATATSLQIEVPTVPTNLRPGDHLMTVVLASGQKSPPFKVTLAGPPEISGITPMGGPCGIDVTIAGKNFSETAADNQVYFGKCKAVVTNASPTSLTVTVPTFPELDGFPAYQMPTGIQVTVSVGNAPTKAESTFYSANQQMTK
jgi:hypothetical protein